jgi:large subunit ribosomal protein L32
MAVPKRRTSNSKRKMGRSHFALSAVATVECSTCGRPKLAHKVCAHCKSYKGKTIIENEDDDLEAGQE